MFFKKKETNCKHESDSDINYKYCLHSLYSNYNCFILFPKTTTTKGSTKGYNYIFNNRF